MKIIVVGALAASLINLRREVLERLRQCGHDVVAMAGDDDPLVNRELDRLGVRFRQYPVTRTGRGPIGDLRTLGSLVIAFRTERPDLVLGYTAKPVIWGGVAARIARVPRFAALITGLGRQFAYPADPDQDGLVRRLYRVALGRATAVVFQNEEDRRRFVDDGLVAPARAHRVNGSGVSLGAFPPVPMPAGPPCFLMLSRLLIAKGVADYIAAAGTVRRRHPECRFMLAGDADTSAGGLGPAAIAALPDNPDVEYLGPVSDLSTIPRLLAAAHVFVLPSRYGEGVPRTSLEAMATGRPVLTTDHPGCRDPVRPGENGWLVAPDDVSSLIDGIERALADASRWTDMGECARRTVECEYDAHEVARRVCDIVSDDAGRVA